MNGRSTVFIRHVLRCMFGFNLWHVAPYCQRAYAQRVVLELNLATCRTNVVEIGCGLGDILRHLEYAEKLGLDQEPEVVRAAAFLGRIRNSGCGRVEFRTATFPEIELETCYDAIVMVNWIHNVPPQNLKSGIAQLFSAHLNIGGQLVFDLVENPSYQFNHSLDFLTAGLPCEARLSEPFEFGRRIAFVTKIGG
jgi:SAM-dependent methyltransferase